MPSFTEQTETPLVKMLLLGRPGSGKTGALTSLVKAGYKLRILDYDGLLQSLRAFAMRDCPDKLNNIEFRSLRDLKKSTPVGTVIPGGPKAFRQGLEMLDHWKYPGVDLGKPAEWGPDCILVIDSLTRLGDAALDWAETIVVRGRDGKFDGRALVGEAQRAIESMFGLISNPAFATNVIVTAHIQYNDMPDGTKEGVPNAPGNKLSPVLPSYFSSLAMCQVNPGEKYVVKTVSTAMINLRNPAPFNMAKELPIETGLADFFKTVKGSL